MRTEHRVPGDKRSLAGGHAASELDKRFQGLGDGQVSALRERFIQGMSPSLQKCLFF